MICLSSLKLVIDTYETPSWSDTTISLLNIIDILFNICFIVESVMKMITFGFILDKNSYLRDSWSCLDFFIALTSIVDMIFEDVNYDFIKILRLLRTLRPLRFLSHYENLRIVVSSLIESIGGIINVIIVILMVWIMFGILGINLMSKRMGYCYMKDDPSFDIFGVSKTSCLSQGGTWETYGWNFDNIFNALITLFILSSLEGWPNIMYTAMNGDVEENGPSLKANYYIFIYFILFILVGSLFLMNLFVGVIFF